MKTGLFLAAAAMALTLTLTLIIPVGPASAAPAKCKKNQYWNTALKKCLPVPRGSIGPGPGSRPGTTTGGS